MRRPRTRSQTKEEGSLLSERARLRPMTGGDQLTKLQRQFTAVSLDAAVKAGIRGEGCTRVGVYLLVGRLQVVCTIGSRTQDLHVHVTKYAILVPQL